MSDIMIGEMYACDFFGSRTGNTCGTRNFLNFLGFAFGFPVLALLALRQNRVWAMLGASQWLILVGILLVHQGHAPNLFYRNMVNCESDSCCLARARDGELTCSRAVPHLPDRHELPQGTGGPADVLAAAAAQDPVQASCGSARRTRS
jgi:hypothetical protein